MRSKNYWFIGATVFILLILATSTLLFHHTRTSSDIIDNVQNIENSGQKEETMEAQVTAPEGTTLPTEVSTHFNYMGPKLPENFQELFNNSDLSSLQDILKLQEILDKHIEELKAQGMFHPMLEPDPTIEKAKQVLADSKAHLGKMNREIESQKKIVFERRESIERFLKDTREFHENFDAWLARHNNAKSTHTPPSDTEPTHTNTDAWQNDLNTYMTTLDADIVNKYPMVTLAQYLTEGEFEARFPTEDAKAFFQTQQQQMLTDITQKINQYLSNNADNRADTINSIRERLSQHWDADMVEQISKQLE